MRVVFLDAPLAETGFGIKGDLREDTKLLARDREPEERRAPRAKISDVATALGLTKATVSRALNGYPDISESTRARVRHKATELGYTPLSHAQAIRTGRARSLGIVLQVGDQDGQRPFVADFLAGLSTAASSENWTLTVATAGTEADMLSTMGRLIDERKADGFVLPRTKVVDERIHMLRRLSVPFVLFGRTVDPDGCAYFDILGEDAMALAVRHLHGLGHRRIGYIGGGDGFFYSAARSTGYRTGMEAVGLPFDPAIVGGGAYTVDAGLREADRLLMADEPPTAIVCATDMCALGVCRRAAALGLRVGGDLSVVGYDGVPEGAWSTPPLATFEVDSRAAGSRLANLLIRRIRGEEPAALRETAHARFLDRGSAGRPVMSSVELRDHVARATGHQPERRPGR